MPSLLFADPNAWRAMSEQSACPICSRGGPTHRIAELTASWLTAGEDAPLEGYACLVAKSHVIEPFELPPEESAAFWNDVMLAARVLKAIVGAMKVNYEIHGNTIPHLHAHVYARTADDALAGRPLTTHPRVRRGPEFFLHLRRALDAELGGSKR